MEDNQIRIPPADGVKPATDELLQLYSCLENYQTCSYPPLKEIPPTFLDKYETVVEGTSDQMTVFPAADDSRFYPVDSNDPLATATGRQISRQNTRVIFDIVVDTLHDSCPEGIKQLLPQLHDGLYWAERAGLSDAEIQEKLDEVRKALEPCLALPPEPPPVVFSPEQAVPEQAVPEPPPAVVEVPPTPEKKQLHFFVEGTGGYYFDSFHSVDLTIAGGLRYLLGPGQRWVIQGGPGVNLWGSPNLLDSDQTAQKDELSSVSPRLFLAGGYVFSGERFELLLAGSWGILRKNQTTYDLQNPDEAPVVQTTTKPDVDLSLQGVYRGFVLSFGYRVGESFHAGLGYELVFGINKPGS